MAGRRLLDAAAFLKASRGVVSRCITLQEKQLDAYSKTSSLAKAIRGQTDRVTLTLRAAATLSERFISPGLRYSTQAKTSDNHPSQESISQRHVEGKPSQTRRKQGLEQDHLDNKSEDNSVAQPILNEYLDVKQVRAKTYPLPDGSIPPKNSQVDKSIRDQDSFSKLQPTAPAEDPLAPQDEDLKNGLYPASSSNSSILNSAEHAGTPPARRARELQRKTENQIPSQPAEPPCRRVPDGNIPSPSDLGSSELIVDQERDVYYTPSSASSPVLSSFPRVKLPKATEDAQLSDEHVPDENINQDVFYSSANKEANNSLPTAQAVPEQVSPSDEIYSEIFHSPRVARLLSGKQNFAETPGPLEMQGSNYVSNTQSKSAADSDQDTYNDRVSQQVFPETHSDVEMPAREPALEHQSDDEIRKLAKDLSLENQGTVSKASEVCSHQYI